MSRYGDFGFDENQPLIIEALEGVGATVTRLDSHGSGVPDLLVGFRRRWFLIEVKNPDKPKKDQRLTMAQVKWHAKQRGHRAPLIVVFTSRQALEAIGFCSPRGTGAS